MLGWLVDERGNEPHATVFDKSARKDGTFSREDFSYDPVNSVYVCPGGKTLTTTGARVNDGETLLYRASKADCDACALRPRCCPNTPARKVPRSIHEKARDMARIIAKFWEGRASRRLNAVRSPQTYSQARPTATTRAKWCPRRVPPRSNCSKPSEAGETDTDPKPHASLRRPVRSTLANPLRDLFNGINQKQK
jgi:hypothetical protein